MSERTEYAPGVPCWADIGTDVQAARSFYSSLFGWDAIDAGPPEESGGYGFFTKDGKMVAGYGPQQDPGPPFWATYVTVADCDEAATQVERAGGTIVAAPMDVFESGRVAVFQDPEGAFLSVWQPRQHPGAEVVNEPGAMSWNELNTRDVDTARAFYASVFGWEPVTTGEGEAAYVELRLDGRSVAGMLPMPAAVPPEVPAHWLVYFAVADTDATVARCQELGGSVGVPPMDIEPGRFAVIADPQGAHFAVIRLAQPDR
jgi:predicted enzyme related to lactoylglutathione lyase